MSLDLPHPEQAGVSILDAYVQEPPSGRNATNIFANEWSSRLPSPYEDCTGAAELFDDPRISWASDLLGGFEGLRVLELGPLEAGHTTMLERGGAESILSIESNVRAYLKCLIVKEVLGLRRAQFMLGDFLPYLEMNQGTFDLCVASGVLYHMVEPMEFLGLLGRTSDRVLLWTHYYDESAVAAEPELTGKFGPSESDLHQDIAYVRYKYIYGEALRWGGFCGGTRPYSYWLRREDILGILRHMGYKDLSVNFDNLRHPNGPAFAVLARR